MDANLLRQYLATVYELPTINGPLRASLDGDIVTDPSTLPELLTLTSAHTIHNRVEVEPFQPFYKTDRRVRDIIERVLASTVSAVQGPPGTGKTTLIVELALQLLRRNPRLGGELL